MQFEWDTDKAFQNVNKHDVTFAEATEVFYDIFSDTADDPDHSSTEDRYVILGMMRKMRLLYISFTERSDIIRIISAREATRNERKLYEDEL